MAADEKTLNLISERAIGCAYKVSNSLGVGFLEKVYESALAHELRKLGHFVEQQKPVDVWYEDIIAGVYICDLLIDNVVEVEIKRTKSICDGHIAQCLNFLRCSGVQLGLVINFLNPKVEIRRVINNYARPFNPISQSTDIEPK
jgi:GxxExxY protein